MDYLTLSFVIGVPLYAVLVSFVVWIPGESVVVITRGNGSHRIARRGFTLKWPIIEKRSKQISKERRELVFGLTTASREGVDFNLIVVITGTLADQASTLLAIANGASTANRMLGRRNFGSLTRDVEVFAQQQLTAIIGRTPSTEVSANVAVIARELAKAINDQATRLGIEDVEVVIPSVISDARFEEAVRRYHELHVIAQAQATRAIVEATEFTQAFGAIMERLRTLNLSEDAMISTATSLIEIWTNFQERRFKEKRH